MVTTALIKPLTRFLEAAQATDRERLLSKKIRPFQRQVAANFQEQGKLFVRNLRALQPVIDAGAVSESISQSDWLPYWNAAARATFGSFSGDTETAVLSALFMGGGQLFEMTNTDAGELGISWNLQNPRAVSFAQQHAAATVTNINSTTQSYLNNLITQALDDGVSYTTLSQQIEAKFTEFATGGDNPRSRRVAVYELGNGYEAGTEMAAVEMEEAGLELEKKWQTVGDGKVRPSHRDNQAQGYIPRGDDHRSGHMRPPTDPGCRCTELYRRKKT